MNAHQCVRVRVCGVVWDCVRVCGVGLCVWGDCIPHVCLQVYVNTRGRFWISAGLCMVMAWWWEPNPGPLKEPQVLLPAEPSLQLPSAVFSMP